MEFVPHPHRTPVSIARYVCGSYDYTSPNPPPVRVRFHHNDNHSHGSIESKTIPRNQPYRSRTDCPVQHNLPSPSHTLREPIPTVSITHNAQRDPIRQYDHSGDFSIAHQKVLYALLENDIDGIVVDKSCQFSPIKTVAGVVGLGGSHCENSLCDDCDAPCQFREIK